MVRAQTNDEGETIGDVEWTKNLYVDADGFVNLCEKAHVASVLGSCVIEAPATRALLPSDELENHQLSVAKERQRERRSGLDSTS